MVGAGELGRVGGRARLVAGVGPGGGDVAAEVEGGGAGGGGLARDGDVAGRAEQFQVILWKGHVVIGSGCHG